MLTVPVNLKKCRLILAHDPEKWIAGSRESCDAQNTRKTGESRIRSVSPMAQAASRNGGRSRRRRRIDWLPYALIAPIALLLLAITVYPTIYAVYLAMTDASLLRLARAQFIGLGNFVAHGRTTPCSSTGCGARCAGTRRWCSLELAIALPIALFLNQSFRGRGIVRAAVMVPYITPPAVVGAAVLSTCSTAISA